MRIELTEPNGNRKISINPDNAHFSEQDNGSTVSFNGEDWFLVKESYSDVMAKIKAAEDKERMDKYACAVIASGEMKNDNISFRDLPHAANDLIYNIDNPQRL